MSGNRMPLRCSEYDELRERLAEDIDKSITGREEQMSLRTKMMALFSPLAVRLENVRRPRHTSD